MVKAVSLREERTSEIIPLVENNFSVIDIECRAIAEGSVVSAGSSGCGVS